VHHSVGCSGHKQTKRGHRESVEDDPLLPFHGAVQCSYGPTHKPDIGGVHDLWPRTPCSCIGLYGFVTHPAARAISSSLFIANELIVP